MKNIKENIIYHLFKCIYEIKPLYSAKLMYLWAFHKRLNIDNPKDINEKIQWLKFYSDTSSWVQLADKYAVREFIKAKGYGDTLVKLYKKWDNIDDISFDDLPNKFVLKVNNGTGDVVIVNNKECENVEKIKKHFREILTPRNAYILGEPHYLKIKPCIIAEELLDTTKQSIKSSSLIDYKIWCTNGKPMYILTCHNRTIENFSEKCLFDTKWHPLPDDLRYVKHSVKASSHIPRPIQLEEMLKMASNLSQGIPVVRVDLYEVNGKIYFGEMTLTPAGGFNTSYSKSILLKMGEQVQLPYPVKKQKK